MLAAVRHLLVIRSQITDSLLCANRTAVSEGGAVFKVLGIEGGALHYTKSHYGSTGGRGVIHAVEMTSGHCTYTAGEDPVLK